ncbi:MULTISPECIES: 3-deoxy-D-manno-octulosonic acid kinase [Colwellia]|uniref:3-deoxy-D-manno-octulosonic acid kinase n=1 Tax=Colwellia marinimaniae TaxID=1513592 RepID=A0ABQ0MRG5_9GAMM|nr:MULTISPECIES: 3-deoxy-D-manno-octulosonic acid kinase [Colwellia]GAW94971.1 3-deoxy-D-manno-octulosonic acid kinase [Colwellia marinimaniae]
MNQAISSEQFTKFSQGNISGFFSKNLIDDFSAKMLEPSYWQQKNAVTGSAQGRGTTWFVAYNDSNNISHAWVLRHYYRGGLMGKIINDSYWFSGFSNTRAAREFALLSHMQTLQLPAPEPIAYRVIRHRLTYQADLLSSRIQNAQDLVAILSEKILADNVWQRIGATIKRFHLQGIYHHDLNSHNILLDDKEQVFLIDFDRGELRQSKADLTTDARWKHANMARLQRSFLKEFNKLTQFNFTEKNWQTLLTGYQNHTD